MTPKNSQLHTKHITNTLPTGVATHAASSRHSNGTKQPGGKRVRDSGKQNYYYKNPKIRYVPNTTTPQPTLSHQGDVLQGVNTQPFVVSVVWLYAGREHAAVCGQCGLVIQASPVCYWSDHADHDHDQPDDHDQHDQKHDDKMIINMIISMMTMIS